MDRILFGDNQFFGVNHVSDEKSRQLSIKFRKDAAVLKTLKTVQQNSENATTANDLSATSREVAHKGGKVVEDAVEAMRNIERSSQID